MEFKRVFAVVSGGLVLCFVAALAVIVATHKREDVAIDNQLSEKIGLVAGRADQDNSDLDMTRVANGFQWDTLYIIDPATPKARINQAIGFKFRGRLNFKVGDLLIFTEGHKLARYADLRIEGGFTNIPRPIAKLRRDQAVFSVHALMLAPKIADISPG